MTLVVLSPSRPLGRIILDGKSLTGTTPGIADMVTSALARAGGDAGAAYAALAGYCNGYLTVIEEPPGGMRRRQPVAAWQEAKHPRDRAGRWAHVGGFAPLEPEGLMTMTGAGATVRAKLDARLAKAQPRRPALPAYGECVARARDLVASLIGSAGTMAEGRGWYPAEHDHAAARARAYGVPLAVAAGVESATSPRTDYDHNQFVTDEILDAAPALASHPAPLESTRGGCLGAFRRDGVAIALGGDLASHLGGAKRRAFYNNIVFPGATDDVTVDTWMLLILGRALGLDRAQVMALGREHPAPWTDGIGRMMIADAVRAAAAGMGESPDAVQAAAWIAGRGKAWAAAAEDLDTAAYDADLIVEYLADLGRDVVLDLGPPHSGAEDGTLAADDQAAWALAAPRLATLGLDEAEARRRVQAAWDPAEHPRDLAGRFAHLKIVGDAVELYHGTTKAGAPDAIQREGLTADRYDPGNRVLTARKDEAGYFASQAWGRPGREHAVVTVRIPLAEMDEYTDVNSQGLVSLRKPLPARMIHQVERL